MFPILCQAGRIWFLKLKRILKVNVQLRQQIYRRLHSTHTPTFLSAPFLSPDTAEGTSAFNENHDVWRCIICISSICTICTTKKIFWLTGMERESVELLLLLLSRHRPLTTHHERLSSNVNEMLSDLCRFLLSLCRSSEESSSGHIQEFLLVTKHLCNVHFWLFRIF